MAHPSLTILDAPKMPGSTLLLALTGWMDGGLVSTGTVRSLMNNRAIGAGTGASTLPAIATIDPDPFYIYNFPGSMEIAALFRPDVKYDDGVITQFDLPENTFHADPDGKLLYFV